MNRANPLLNGVERSFDAEIAATRSLDPLLQAERLIAAYTLAGADEPAFVAVLVGELVITRLRLSALDPRALNGDRP